MGKRKLSNKVSELTDMLSDERERNQVLAVQVEQAGLIVEQLHTELADNAKLIVRLKAEVMTERDKVRRQKVTIDDLMDRLGYVSTTPQIDAQCPDCHERVHIVNGEWVHVIKGTPMCPAPSFHNESRREL